jgi:hypothetical protein
MARTCSFASAAAFSTPEHSAYPVCSSARRRQPLPLRGRLGADSRGCTPPKEDCRMSTDSGDDVSSSEDISTPMHMQPAWADVVPEPVDDGGAVGSIRCCAAPFPLLSTPRPLNPPAPPRREIHPAQCRSTLVHSTREVSAAGRSQPRRRHSDGCAVGSCGHAATGVLCAQLGSTVALGVCNGQTCRLLRWPALCAGTCQTMRRPWGTSAPW